MAGVDIPVNTLRESFAYHVWIERKRTEVLEKEFLLAAASDSPEAPGVARKAFKAWLRAFWAPTEAQEEAQEDRMKSQLDRVRNRAIAIRRTLDLDDNMSLELEGPR